MKVFIYVISDELSEIAQGLIETMTLWVEEQGELVTMINNYPEGDTLGIQLQIKKPKHLQVPVNFLNGLANQFKCDFVLGIIDDDAEEEICYFGKHEGRPDIFEIASYLGLE